MDVRPAGSAERRDLHLDADRPCIDRIAGRMTQSEGTNGVSDWSERFEVSIDGAWTGIFTRLEFAYSNDVERERERLLVRRTVGRLGGWRIHRLLNFYIECL